MSLDNETLKKIMEVQKDTLELVKKVLDLLQQINDTIADNHQEILTKIHELDAFCRNILEKNQHTIWNYLLGKPEEVEQPKDTEP